MVISKLSPRGRDMIFMLEGCPLKAYKDVGGVVTIGPGFTNLSRVVREYWIATRGHELRMGDTMTMAEARELFPKVLDEEFGAAVVRQIAPTLQHHYDAASSVSYNAGTGSLNWNWATALRKGLVVQAAKLLRTTAVTAGGRPVEGLRTRRRIEAHLLETGEYMTYTTIQGVPAAVDEGASLSVSPAAIREYQQQLKTLGYYRGEVDGKAGKLTIGAVENFQRAEGLEVDGKVGPATRAALARAITAKARNVTATTAGAAPAGGGVLVDRTAIEQVIGVNPFDSPLQILLWMIIAVAVVWAAYSIWNNRGVILRKRTPA